MATPADFLADLVEQFKHAAAALWHKLQTLTPHEEPYAILFEISEQSPQAWPIAATEESLSRLAATYVNKGYRAKNGNHLELLRVAERWDAPGDQIDGWYWGDERTYGKLNSLLEKQFGASCADHDRSYHAVQKICLQALKELDSEGTFGTGPARNNLVIGITNVENDFETFLDQLATVNPKPAIVRLRRQLKDGRAAWDKLSRPAR